MNIDRRTYADHYGPTTGDRIRLADTDLIIEIESDAATYGDEAKFGGGKVIRDGMGQSPTATRASGAPDLAAAGAHAGMRCVERASLFHCSFAPSGGSSSGVIAVMTVLALTLGRRRRRQRTRG